MKDILKNILDHDGQVKVNYSKDKKTKIKILMKESLQYLSIGHTIANGTMLPHLDLFGNNLSFF